MNIWFNKSLSLKDFEGIPRNTLDAHLGIELIEIGPDFLKARMPVDDRTKQPYGLLHGGASLVLAETLGSFGAAMVIDLDEYLCVGQEINANHFQMTYYLLIFLLVLVGYFSFQFIKEKDYKGLGIAFGVLAIAGIFAIGANATNLLATTEYTKFSTRGKNELTFNQIIPTAFTSIHFGLW